MKKNLILFLLCLIGINTFSQKIIDNPKFSATTASYVKITRIELYDTATVFSFEVKYFPNWWINVSSKVTGISDSKGGGKLLVKRAEGIELNKNVFTPQTGINSYKLIFPPLNPKTELIDFEEEQWKIFNIEIVPQKSIAVIHEELNGNWLRTDGSNEWVLGIHNNLVIYGNEVWDKVSVVNKKGLYILDLKRDGKTCQLFVKPTKDNNILFGTDPKKLSLLSQTPSYKKDYVLKDDNDFKLPVFNKDTFVYQGFIKGYHPKMGKTGMAYVDDILYQEQYSNLININPDGTFKVKFPMIHPQPVYVRLLGGAGSYFMEPGKQMFQFIDVSEFNQAFKSNADYNKREHKSLFMGDIARINTDLAAMDSISYFDYDEMRNKILDMDGEQYKAYCFTIMNREKEAFQRYASSHQICKKASAIKQMDISYRTYEQILSYNMNRESAYRQKNKVPRDQREIPLKGEMFQPGYYSFIKMEELNNPVSLVCGSSYNILINRIQYADCVRRNLPANYFYKLFKDSIKAASGLLTAAEEQFLDKLINITDKDSSLLQVKKDSVLWKGLAARNQKVMLALYQTMYDRFYQDNYKKYFGITTGLVNDIMFSQTMCGRMKGRQKPFSDEDTNKIKQTVKSEFIANYVLQFSKNKELENARKLAENKNKTGYVVNETPKTPGDKLFDAIVAKYKGKVVFVDFWATWCGPCRAGIENMKPMKEEYKGKDVVFLYITDESSPVDTWNMMVPDIKGEHYRVKSDEWNYLKSKFQISGIPHYALVNRAGTIVKDKIYFASSDGEFKELINECLKQ
ncbi:MAG: TlpA disulfide reductase family protein [Bacteroidota bacterium]|nr:TlpA disulfide reductase family protein [Bacteroidota bacterium]